MITPEIIRIKSGETLKGQTFENAIVWADGRDNIALRQLKLINGVLRIWNCRNVTVEDIECEGGMPTEEQAIHLGSVTNARLSDIRCFNVQRGINLAVNALGSSQLVIDGLTVRGHVNHVNIPNRAEAVLFHGYASGTQYALDLELRNVSVSDWSGGANVTFWDTGIDRAIVSECNLPGGVQVGFGTQVRPVKQLHVRRPFGGASAVRYRLYVPPINADLLGDIQLPKGWRHVVQRNHPSNGWALETLGEFDSVEEVRQLLREIYPDANKGTP